MASPDPHTPAQSNTTSLPSAPNNTAPNSTAPNSTVALKPCPETGVIQLQGVNDVWHHTLKMLSLGRRSLRILSHHLDPILFDQPEFAQALSTLARQHRSVDIRIIVRESRPLVEHGHRVLKLANRLPSKIHLRRLPRDPESKDLCLMMVDNDKLLYRPDERDYSGFANHTAGPEVKHFDELFTRLWQNAAEDPQLRQVYL